MEYIISPVWILLDFLMLTVFFHSFFPLRHGTRASVLIFALMWCLLSICAFLLPDGYGYRAVSVAVALLMLLLLYKGALSRHLLCAAVGLTYVGIVDIVFSYGVCLVLRISYSELIWKKLLYIMTVTTGKLAGIFLTYLFMKYRRRRQAGAIQRRWLLLTLLFPVSSLVMMFIIFASSQDSQDLSLSAFIYALIMFVSNFAILYLINIMEKRTKEEQQLTLLNQQMEIQARSITALNQSYQNHRRAAHEHMHQLQTIADLLDRGEEETVRRYISQLQGTRRTASLNINTHNPILDAILNQKYQWAGEHGIKMEFQVNDLSGITLGLNELVVLFSNLLDNAIEACLKLPADRSINCRIIHGDALFISIRNTSPPVEIVNGMIETTKKPKHEHGFGLPNIRHILSGLSAEYAYHYADGWFHFVAEIPLPQ